jgi:hypothetical protein
MKCLGASIICLLMLANCSPTANQGSASGSADRPSIDVVRRIEKELSRDPCLGKLASMRREYRFYAPGGGEVERNLVRIKVQEAGFDGLAGGIYILGPPETSIIDDRSHFVAYATYHTERYDLDLWACGDNAPGGDGIRHRPRY